MKNKCLWFMIFLGVFVMGAEGSEVASTEKKDVMSERDRIAVYKKQRRVGDLQVGDDAPDFQLESADGKGVVQLSSFEGKRDVVLIFGSYT